MTGVSTTHADYDRLSPDWKICRDVIAGERAMHNAGEAYLPKLIDETQDGYDARRKRSNFFNGSWRTLSGMVGLLFRLPPTTDLPAGIKTYLADVTLSGVSLDTFVKNIAYEVLGPGRVGILVDHPPKPENVSAITVDAATKLGLRPTLQIYPAESIINWRFARVANAWVLSQVVLRECHYEPKDEFEDKEVTQYRVLDLAAGQYRQRIFKRERERDEQVGGDIIPLMNGAPLDYIPFKIVGAEGGDSDADEPPMIDLFNANVALYQVNSDRRHGLHFTALPTPVVSGYIPEKAGEKLYIGSTTAWVFPQPEAKAAFLEFQGQGLDAIKDYALELKQEMAVLGARMLADETKQVETLGATIIKRTGENSLLASIADSISEAMEWALGVFAKWAGQSGAVVYQLNRNFMPTPMDAQTLTALVGSWQSGALSERELFDALQRGEVIDSEQDFEAHVAEVEVQTPPAPKPAPAKPGVAA